MSYVAAPPANPIDIDGGIEYKYVIAQQGAITISVDPDADFTFTINSGSPALLRLTFTGTVTAVPQYKTVTVRLHMPEGDQTHTPNFRILPTSATQRVPNILNGKSLAVQASQNINFLIATDIAITSFNAAGLPAGLTVNTTNGRIQGTAPATSGFYVITLVANNSSYSYKRYFVIVVGTGLPEPIGIPPGPPADTSRIFYDGDFTVAQIAGSPEYEIPFAADPKPYAYKLAYWQFLANFSEPNFGDPGPLGGVYVGGSPGTFKTIGGGVIEFSRTYARIPDSRSEFESYVYNYQFWFPCIGRTGTSKLSITTLSRVQYDYFQTSDPGEIDLPRAPVFWDTGGIPAFLNGWWDIKCQESGYEVLAEDATLKIWKPGIYARTMRFVRWISCADILFE